MIWVMTHGRSELGERLPPLRPRFTNYASVGVNGAFAALLLVIVYDVAVLSLDADFSFSRAKALITLVLTALVGVLAGLLRKMGTLA